MTSNNRTPGTQASAHFEDEFASYVSEAQGSDPQFRAAFEDAEDLQDILDSLVKLRKALNLSQTTVAHRMGVKQPTVSGFETESSDPRLSTLQRYARAVEARIRLTLEMPASCDWVSASTQAYGSQGAVSIGDSCPGVRRSGLARTWRPASTGSWELVA